MAKRNHSTWLVRPLQILAMGTLLLSPVAHPQAIGASAKNNTAPSVTQDDMKVMRQQIQALAARVKQLEEQANQASGDSGDDKQSKAQAKQSAHNSREATDEGLTVVAPFTVVDGKGKIIIRVGEAGNGDSRGIYAYDESGHSVAHMGNVVGFGGRVYINRPGTYSPDIGIGVGRDGPSLFLKDGVNMAATLTSKDLEFYSADQKLLSSFGTKNRVKGFLQLGDSNGDAMVEAGVLDVHKGYVLANPIEESMGPNGNPSVLKGVTKKK